jgi:hypothetical protein
MGGVGGAELVAGHGRFQVGQAVERHGAVRIVEHGGHVAGGRVGAQMDAGTLDQAGGHAQAAGRVVVAADHDGGNAEVGEAVQGVVVEVDCVQSGDGAVVDVAGNKDRVHLVLPHGGQQVVEEDPLVVDERLTVEGPTQVPVRGVEKPHGG